MEPPGDHLAAAAGWQDPAVLALARAVAEHTTAAGQAELARTFPSLYQPAPPGTCLPRLSSALTSTSTSAGPWGSRRRADLVLQLVCADTLAVVLPICRSQLLRELRSAQRRRRRDEPDRPCTGREQRRTGRALTAATTGVALLAAQPDAVLRRLLAQSLSALAQASLTAREPS